MNASVLFTSHWLIVVHACAAMAAMLLGAIQLMMRKGSDQHRMLGYVWVTLMATVSLTSFGIFEIRLIGPFSPIHLLSILVIYTLTSGIRHARAGRLDKHRKAMVALYIQGLILTGAFTLYPGRVMHGVLFGA